MVRKRGQITLFIALGIVILLLMGLGYYFLRSSNQDFSSILPSKEAPKGKIADFTTECIQTTAKAAVLRLGSQGGYVTLPPYIEKNPAANLGVDSLRILRIPYWYYRGEDRMPSLAFMEQEIASYVTENLPSCLLNYSAFSNEYTVRQRSEIQTKVTIGAQNVRVDVTYAIEAEEKTSGEKTRMGQFSSVLPVKLKKVYDLAKSIHEAENRDAYLENVTLQFISLDTKNIPLTHMTFHCGQLTWRIVDVKERLQDLLYYNFPRIRVKNTNTEPFLSPDEEYERLRKYSMDDINAGNYPDEEAPEDAYEYFHFQWDTTSVDFKDITASVIYEPHYGMDMKVYPSQGGIMKSNVGKGTSQFLSYLCINVYHFVYDVSYPVQIVLRDDSSFDGEGYVFRMAVPVIINSNEADKKVRGIFNPELAAFDQSEEFCSQRSLTPLEITVVGRDGDIPETELPYVNISYECLRYTCKLGQTNLINAGHIGAIVYPPQGCSNGEIIAEKDGYLTSKKQHLGEEALTMQLEKTRMFNVSFVKAKSGQLSSVEPLAPEDVVVVQLTTRDKPYIHEDSLVFPTEGAQASDDAPSITLIDGAAMYDLNIFLTKEGQNDVLYGGYFGNWTLGRQDMTGKNTVQFKLVELFPPPSNEEQELSAYEYLTDNAEYKQVLKPSFIVTGGSS